MTNEQMIQSIREALYKLLERKTSWGKNEIKVVFEEAIGEALLIYIDN